MKKNVAHAGRLFVVVSLCLSSGAKAAPAEPSSSVTPLEWSMRMAESEMARRGDSLEWKAGGKAKWDYTAGLFTLSLLKLNESAPVPGSVDFVKRSIGSFIAPDGEIHGYRPDEYQLDALNPGKTVLELWQITGDERYKKAALTLLKQLDTQPRTSDGGFWHKERYTHQMWLDGLYMGAPFYAACAETFGGPDRAFDDIAKQFRLIDEHTYDPKTGLFYHGWDESKSQPWANPQTGCSSNFWGRAVGWYAMALVDTLDYFPTNHPARPQLVAELQKLAAGMVKWQDPVAGVWWQVMDQGGRPGNYLEATASSMFVYALAKGVNHGYLPRDYIPAVKKGYAGIIHNFIRPDGENRWSLTHCCSVAGLGGSPSNGKARDGSFDYYVSEQVVTNDLKGVGPFILAGIEVQSLFKGADWDRSSSGPFQPTWKSLEEQYQTPEWFRDAKFGIWAHWGPQCVPEDGDWYARNMYIEGNKQNKFHVAHYGPPSKFGFKDVIHEWKAEHWDPEKLMELYKKAGAKYFVAMANHVDNFDNFNSRFQPWNSVNMGPKQDIVGIWEKAARREGLHFGVSVHASHAWSWLEPSQGADTNGPLAGVPYDGTLTKADGKGLWWDGYDPQDLYAQNHKPGRKLEWMWDASKGSSIPDQAYCETFYNRTIDLMNSYRPDLVYFDDSILPLHPVSDVGLRIAAHYYNASIQWHGHNEAVMTTKELNPEQARGLVMEIERGKTQGISPLPWQSDTCIGSWHYDRHIYLKNEYKTPAQIIPLLADIVSKNGNLLLSIPLRGDGTADQLEIKFLKDMAAWMAINGEAIYRTRPWKIFGEGPSAHEKPQPGRHGGVADIRSKPFVPEDIRFTQSKDGRTLYAIFLAWPESGRLTVESLAAGSEYWPDEIGGIHLLGASRELKFTRDDQGLHVTLPKSKPCKTAFALKITR